MQYSMAKNTIRQQTSIHGDFCNSYLQFTTVLEDACAAQFVRNFYFAFPLGPARQRRVPKCYNADVGAPEYETFAAGASWMILFKSDVFLSRKAPLSKPARLSKADQLALRNIPDGTLLDERVFAVTLILMGFSRCDRITVSDEICASGFWDILPCASLQDAKSCKIISLKEKF
jgi:hypothetical protein